MGYAGRVVVTAPIGAAGASVRVRLHFLDGIRGLAALYVLIFHSLTIGVPQESDDLSFAMGTLRAWFGYGHFAVVVFIVLSGFSLTIPLARRSVLRFERGFGQYIWRRSRRVLPAYYAAMVFSIVAIIAASVVPGASTTARSEALTPGSLLSHVFLVHNWNFDWAYRINGPMWSVATEWQIYFLFPFVILPLWRRTGAAITIALAWGIPLALHLVLPADANLSWAAPWFVGSFALGVWGALVMFDPDESAMHRARTLPWGWIASVTFAILVVILAITGTSWELPYLDLVVSVMSIALILACVGRHLRSDGDGGGSHSRGVSLNGFLGSKPLVALGGFSYSLYLLQHPMLRLTEALLGETNLGYEMILWTQLIIGTPIIMLVSRIFAEFFEMPFTTGSSVWAAWKSRRSPAMQAPAPARADSPTSVRG